MPVVEVANGRSMRSKLLISRPTIDGLVLDIRERMPRGPIQPIAKPELEVAPSYRIGVWENEVRARYVGSNSAKICSAALSSILIA